MLYLGLILSVAAIAKLINLARALLAGHDRATLQSNSLLCHDHRIPDESLERPLSWQGFRTFIVAKRVQETENVTSLVLVPQDGKPLPSFSPGQFVMLSLKIPGHKRSVKRCYSLSAAPSRDHFRITFKLLPDGTATNYLQGTIQVGMTLDVSAPQGRFFLREETRQPLVLIAGGIGITPFLSMTDLVQSRYEKTVLVYSVRNGREHVAKEEIQKLSSRCPHLRVITIYTAPDQGDLFGLDYDGTERITIDALREFVDVGAAEFYLCGSLSMTQSLQDQLVSAGVLEEQIHVEGFGEPRQFTPTVTASNQGKTDHSPTIAANHVSVTFEKSNKTLLWQTESETLLDLAEKNNIALESVCRSGDCGACQIGILKGRVRYEDGERSLRYDNSCLPCVAKPASDLVLNA